jgi:aminomethyltransferase
VQGPKAAGIVERIAPGVSSLGRMSCEERELGGVRVVVARSGYTGEDGFEIFCPVDSVVALWRTLLGNGKEDGLLPCGLGARDTLRVEAALPLYGHELGGDISPYEVRVGWAVKRNRPDMVGFEALEKAAKSAPRRLIGLLVEGGIAREGAPVFVAGGAEAVGTVTSGTHSPTLGRAIAMALVTKEAAAAAGAGTATTTGASGAPAAFEIEVRGKRRAALVTGLPFCVKRPHPQ